MTVDPLICRPVLESVLEERPASSILAIGEGSEAVFERYLDGRGDVSLTSVPAGEIGRRITGIERHDLALIGNTFERLPKDEGAVLIGRLRDLCSERLYVLLPMGAGWEGHASVWRHADMLAYGFSLVMWYPVSGRRVNLYVHDLYDYKRTPDWLNPSDWANPELWDKFRW